MIRRVQASLLGGEVEATIAKVWAHLGTWKSNGRLNMHVRPQGLILGFSQSGNTSMPLFATLKH